jgi:hypothetical protein
MFNRILTKDRVIIERCFGQVKKRFPILRGQVRIQLHRVPILIVACFVLHNVAKYLQDGDDDFMDVDPDDEHEDLDGEEGNDAYIRQLGQERRRVISRILHGQVN